MKQNEISHTFLDGSDLGGREQEVLEDAVTVTGFTPSQIISRSSWWGSTEIGAFHCAGEFKGKKAVLKIQGVKPNVSEIYMIQSFENANKSSLVRPPYLYASSPWDEEKRYEALVLESIDGERVIHIPTNQKEIDRFFEIYKDYRKHCLQKPWVEKPEGTISEGIENNFSKWRETSLKIYPDHPLRKTEDENLINEAIEILLREYQNIKPEFMHGHLSDGDFYEVGDQVVVLSNLYWSWRQPFYDAIFAYHWFIYHLNEVPDITPNEVEDQRSLWLDKIKSLAELQIPENTKLLNLALLERACAGLVLDGLVANPKKPITEYLLEATRGQIQQLISTLS
jgi:hypothetical protein